TQRSAAAFPWRLEGPGRGGPKPRGARDRAETHDAWAGLLRGVLGEEAGNVGATGDVRVGAVPDGPKRSERGGGGGSVAGGDRGAAQVEERAGTLRGRGELALKLHFGIARSSHLHEQLAEQLVRRLHDLGRSECHRPRVLTR